MRKQPAAGFWSRRLFLYVWTSRQKLFEGAGWGIRLLKKISDQMLRIMVDFEHIRSPSERLPLKLQRDVGVVGCPNYQEEIPLLNWNTQLWATSYSGAGSS